MAKKKLPAVLKQFQFKKKGASGTASKTSKMSAAKKKTAARPKSKSMSRGK